MGQETDYTQPPWGSYGRNVTFGVISGWANVVMHVLNDFEVSNLERFRQYVIKREAGTPLFTVCNHTSTLDDPVVLCGLLPWSFFWSESRHGRVRWSLCAKEICYKNIFTRTVFQNGKTLPIDRAAGISQPIMAAAASRAAAGDWVHVFPEAKVGYTGQLMPLKRGIGKLFCDSLKENPTTPVVLPFYHSGMGRILPKGCVLPRVGYTVKVTVGQPIDLTELSSRCNCEQYKQSDVWSAITQKVSEALIELERESVPNWDQTRNQPTERRERAPPVNEKDSHRV